MKIKFFFFFKYLLRTDYSEILGILESQIIQIIAIIPDIIYGMTLEYVLLSFNENIIQSIIIRLRILLIGRSDFMF